MKIVTTISMEITQANGDVDTLQMTRVSDHGDNPRFLGESMSVALSRVSQLFTRTHILHQ